ncbi:hypothetical protein NW768_011515 [Fusarium equiseti]|uniref:Uncharacterized protein n=1 Tax=Fusarium equiseti TaxID=61235 RepID=A0ABQ8QX70_FUSEQ|nr:hypothetical protein NW768_011515 [Fusarium equiseti]
MTSPMETEHDSDTRSVSSIDSYDPPPTIETKTITRKQVLEEMGDLLLQLFDHEFDRSDQESARPQIAKLIHEHILSVLPTAVRVRITRWCARYHVEWLPIIHKSMDHDLEECRYTVEIPNRRRDMPWKGVESDVLRNYVADLKPLRKGLPEAERRDVINAVRQGLTIFADMYDEKIGAMDEQDDLVDWKEDMESSLREVRSSIQIIGSAIHDLGACVERMEASFQEVKDRLSQGSVYPYVEREWHRSLNDRGVVPESLRRYAEYQCTSGEMFRLGQMEQAFSLGEVGGH